MAKFNLDKRGYNPAEVDDYINSLILKYEDRLTQQKDRVTSLRKELSDTKKELEVYLDKDKQISKALLSAVEKADEIEAGAKRLFDLEKERIDLLYSTWQEIVSSLYALEEVQDDEYLKEMLSVFKETLEKAVVQSPKREGQIPKGDYVKNVLVKMRKLITEKDDAGESIYRQVKSKLEMSAVAKEHKRESNRLSSIKNRLKDISIKVDNDINDYAVDASFEGNAYEKNIGPNKKIVQQEESGFDINEALNPKEDLEEIMKAFDFARNKKK